MASSYKRPSTSKGRTAHQSGTGQKSPRPKTSVSRKLNVGQGQNEEEDQYEIIEEIPKSKGQPRTKTYQYPQLSLEDFQQWRPKTPKLSPRTVWTTNRKEDPSNTIRTHRSRVQTAQLTTRKPEDWKKFSAEMKMYLPRNFRFMLEDPELLRRLAKDPDWLSKLEGHLNELQMSYLRIVRSARVSSDKKKEEVRVAVISQRKEIEIVKLPMVKSWQNESIPAQKLDIGQPKVGEREKTLILIGTAGTGKSMLVDSMVNYVLQVEWEDSFRLRVTSERDRNNWVNAFTIPQTNHTKLPYTLNIVDFPAYGRDKGTQAEDAKWMKNFNKFFESHTEHNIDSIHTICFVQRADETAVAPVQKYVYQQFVALFGEGVKDNVCNLVTFADKDDEKPPAVQALESEGLPHENCFVFNNAALYHGEKKNEDGHDKHNQDGDKGNNNDDNKDDDESFFKKFWERRENNFEKVFNCIDKMKPRSMFLDEDTLNQKEDIEDSINHLRVLIQGNSQKLQQLEVEKKLIKEHQEEIQQEEDFSYKVYNVEKVKRDTPHCGDNVTNCSICYTTCHQNCAIARDEDKAGCWAMTDGYCRICTGKCKWDKHYNRIFIFYLRINQADKMFSQLSQEHQVSHKDLPAALQREYTETEVALRETIKKSREGINSLNKICSKNNGPLTQNGFIDMVIHEELREGTPGWKERIEILKKMKTKGQVTIKMKGINTSGKVI